MSVSVLRQKVKTREKARRGQEARCTVELVGKFEPEQRTRSSDRVGLVRNVTDSAGRSGLDSSPWISDPCMASSFTQTQQTKTRCAAPEPYPVLRKSLTRSFPCICISKWLTRPGVGFPIQLCQRKHTFSPSAEPMNTKDTKRCLIPRGGLHVPACRAAAGEILRL